MTKMETHLDAAAAVTTADATTAAANAARDPKALIRRKRLFIALAAVVLKCALGYGVYDYLYASHFISTDNAYTAAETAQVTPAVSGIVREVRVTDTQAVKAGDIVLILDGTDARLALAQAEAELGRAQRRVRSYVASDTNLSAQISARTSDVARADAQIAAATADFERAETDLRRREALAVSGAISEDELTRTRNAFASAKANLDAARAGAAQTKANYAAALGARDANAVMIADSSEDTNPEVALARARRDQAEVNLQRTVVRAPIDGVVARRSVQVGQQVQAGSALLSIVPLTQMHVDANFKEVQLDRVRIGQPVTLVSDLYGDEVTYHGVVDGLSAGTGSVFATIPAQNATGNWIKVVQRLPVRIRIDAAQLAQRPLQMGLSMHATIDTREML